MENKEYIKVLYKKVNSPLKEIKIKNDLVSKQKLVGGLIEVIPYRDNILLICNEEGKINNLPANIMFPYDVIAGNCFFIGDSMDGDFRSLTNKEILAIKKDIPNRSINYKKDIEKCIDD